MVEWQPKERTMYLSISIVFPFRFLHIFTVAAHTIVIVIVIFLFLSFILSFLSSFAMYHRVWKQNVEAIFFRLIIYSVYSSRYNCVYISFMCLTLSVCVCVEHCYCLMIVIIIIRKDCAMPFYQQ